MISYDDLTDAAKMAAFHRKLADKLAAELGAISPAIGRWARQRAIEGFTADAIRHALKEQQRQAEALRNNKGRQT